MTLDRPFSELYLVQELAEMLLADGYAWLPARHQFRHEQAEGFQNVIIAISPYDDAVLIEFHLGIRWHALEEIVGEATRALPRFRPDDHTLVVSQGKLLGQRYFRYQAADTDQLDEVATEFRQFWEETGREFLSRNFSIEYIHQCFNGAPRRPCLYLPNQAHRYLRGIAAARLAQSPDFEQLAFLYELGLAKEPQGPILMREYKELVAYLDAI